MKSPRFHGLLSFLVMTGGLSAQSAESPVRIIGAIPDGSPLPPPPQQPGFKVQREEIRSEKLHRQGGRNIIVRSIESPALNSIKPAAPRSGPEVPAILREIGERQAETLPDDGLILMGATVFILPDGKVRTLIHLWPKNDGTPAVFWSSADFRLLAPIHRIACDDGFERALVLAWSVEHLNSGRAAALAIPDFPEGEAEFIRSDHASDIPAEVSSIVRSLHTVYRKDRQQLLTAFRGRESERLLKEAEEKANPPRPQNLTLQTWTLREPVTGATKNPQTERGVR